MKDDVIITRQDVRPRKSGYTVRYLIEIPDGPVRAVHNVQVIVTRGRTTVKVPANVDLDQNLRAAIYAAFSKENLYESVSAE